jgi:hypothetical protein
MNSELLNYPTDIPEDVDGVQWLRYVKGTRWLDEQWSRGQRCPSNEGPDNVKCRCLRQSDRDYCRGASDLEGIAAALGGATAAMWERLP